MTELSLFFFDNVIVVHNIEAHKSAWVYIYNLVEKESQKKERNWKKECERKIPLDK